MVMMGKNRLFASKYYANNLFNRDKIEAVIS